MWPTPTNGSEAVARYDSNIADEFLWTAVRSIDRVVVKHDVVENICFSYRIVYAKHCRQCEPRPNRTSRERKREPMPKSYHIFGFAYWSILSFQNSRERAMVGFLISWTWRKYTLEMKPKTWCYIGGLVDTVGRWRFFFFRLFVVIEIGKTYWTLDVRH